MRKYQSGKLLVVLFILFTAMLLQTARAQAPSAASRSAEFDAFGGFTYVNSAYHSSSANYGLTLGMDYTQFLPRFRGLIIPSFQVRGTLTPGPIVGERTLAAGLRLATTYKRLHPYGNFLVGSGTITFNHPAPTSSGQPYSHDNSFVYDYGGGLTFDTHTNFSAMVDYQHQYWDLGEHPPNRFYPVSVTVGVLYHINLHPYR